MKIIWGEGIFCKQGAQQSDLMIYQHEYAYEPPGDFVKMWFPVH